jgi:hypothetical protein
MIGKGWQYTVYDIGNNRVLKKRYSRIAQTRFIYTDQKRKQKPVSVWNAFCNTFKVDRRAVNASKYVQILLIENSLPFLGNPVFISNVNYEQDKVIPLREFLNISTVAESKTMFDQYAKLIQLLWHYGFSELTYNFLGNSGVNKENNLILSDFGELVFKKEEILQHIKDKKWLQATAYKMFPEGELKEYYEGIMEKELTEGFLDKHFKKQV